MNDFESNFALQLFHLSDQEANTTTTELAPNLSAVYNALAAQDIDGDGVAGHADSLFLSSGDAWIPGLFYDASEALYGAPGAADILIQNELGIQAISFGNHEFDNGTGIIAELVSGDIAFDEDAAPEDFLPFAGANFPYLAGNLNFGTDPNLAPLATEDGQNVGDISGRLAGTALVTTEGGETIGLVSSVVSTIEDGLSSPGPDLEVLPESNALADVAALIQQDVDALLAANPGLDKIILLSHQQVLSREQGLATLLEGVDIIVAGGSNSVLLDETDPGFDGEAADGVYPGFFTAADGAPVAVVNTDAAYNYLGRLVIDFDENGEIIPESYDPDLSGAFETSEDGVARVGGEGLADPEIVAIAEDVQAVIAEGEGNFFAVSDVFLNAERAGGSTDGVRTQETNLGNLTADANLWYAEQVFGEDIDVSFKNGGGIRANIGRIVQPAGDAEPERLPPEGVPGVKPEGGISENDVANTLAFNNGLTLLSLSTEQLVETIEGTLENYTSLEESAGGWGQFGGVRFSFDPAREPGSRIVNAAVVDDETGEVTAELVRDGELVDNGDQTFRTVTLNFLANGGAEGLPVTDPTEDGFDPAIAAATERAELYKDADGDLGIDDDAPATGAATFAPDGTEQDALAEYLLSEFGREGETTVQLEDTPPAGDERIQNLDFRGDTVFGPAETGPAELRVASFNASLNRGSEGELIEDLSTGEDAQARNVAEIIQRTAPDILLINEFDFDAEGEAAELFQDNYLSVSQGGAEPIDYAHRYVVPSNTGIPSGFDLNNDGTVATEADQGTAAYANDAQGFGFFEGQFGFVIYSQHEIDVDGIRSFQEFLWKDMPDALLFEEEGGRPLFDPERPFDPANPDDADTSFYTEAEVDALRLSSKNHVDVPVTVDGETVHILAAHPTPPVFDGPEDRNGKRNFDEIRFWKDYVAGADYITDDAGTPGGLADGERFVIVGDYNADPFDGDSRPGAAQQLLANDDILASTTDPAITPAGQGGVDSASGGANDQHRGNPAFDTADFGFNPDNPAEDVAPGNLRVDYALPSAEGFQYLGGEVVWPADFSTFADVTSFPTSDHRMVFTDVRVVSDAATLALGEAATVAAREVTFDGAFRDGTIFTPRDGGFDFAAQGSNAVATVFGAETFVFDDVTLVADRGEASATVARAYATAFDRDYKIDGATFWTGLVEEGQLDLGELGARFVDSLEFAERTGSDLDDDAFVDAIIANAVPGGLGEDRRDALVAELESGAATRGEVLIDVAQDPAVVEYYRNETDDGVLLLA